MIYCLKLADSAAKSFVMLEKIKTSKPVNDWEADDIVKYVDGLRLALTSKDIEQFDITELNKV